MAREPRAVRKAREQLGSAYERQADTAANGAEMRRFLQNTSQSHQGVRSENQANRAADRNVRRAGKALDKAVEAAVVKKAKKDAKKQARKR